jgi:hypothetical protein
MSAGSVDSRRITRDNNMLSEFRMAPAITLHEPAAASAAAMRPSDVEH